MNYSIILATVAVLSLGACHDQAGDHPGPLARTPEPATAVPPNAAPAPVPPPLPSTPRTAPAADPATTPANPASAPSEPK